MFASTIVARNIIRSTLSKLNVPFDKHTYTDKTSKNDPDRRTVVFKIPFSTDIDVQRSIVATINSEFKQLGYENECTVSSLSFAYVRVIAYI